MCFCRLFDVFLQVVPCVFAGLLMCFCRFDVFLQVV